MVRIIHASNRRRTNAEHSRKRDRVLGLFRVQWGDSAARAKDMTDREASIVFGICTVIFLCLSPWGTQGNNIIGAVGSITCGLATVRLIYVGWFRN